MQRVAGEKGDSLVMRSGALCSRKASKVGFFSALSFTLCSTAVRSPEPLCPGWLSPAPKVCSTQGPHGQEDPGLVSLCKDARALANPWEHVCKTLMSECIRVSLTSAGTGFSVGGSDAAELRAGRQAAGRARGHARWSGPGLSKRGVCLHLRRLCLGAWCGRINTAAPCLLKHEHVAWDPRAVQAISVVFLNMQLQREIWDGGIDEPKGWSSPQVPAWRGQRRQGKLLSRGSVRGNTKPVHGDRANLCSRRFWAQK